MPCTGQSGLGLRMELVDGIAPPLAGLASLGCHLGYFKHGVYRTCHLNFVFDSACAIKYTLQPGHRPQFGGDVIEMHRPATHSMRDRSTRKGGTTDGWQATGDGQPTGRNQQRGSRNEWRWWCGYPREACQTPRRRQASGEGWRWRACVGYVTPIKVERADRRRSEP